jgi:hypothetical protein
VNLTNILQVALGIAPSIVQAVQVLFSHKPKNGPLKAQAALNMAQQGIMAALELDSAAFGDAEKQLIVSVHDAVVAYYNAKGWPTAQVPAA